jgi:hypothetical protein
MQQTLRLLAPILCLAGFCSAASGANRPDDLLKTIKAVADQGRGNVAATRAMRALTQSDASSLLVILRAFEGAGPIAANWLRSAVETIADRELKQGRALPVEELVKFIVDRKQVPRARRLAFELLQRVDREQAETLVPGMLHDPSADLRREAVGRLIDEAAKLHADGQADDATHVYRKALSGAVQDDQVQAIVAPLKKLGHKVNLPKHFGFLTRWHVIGPFNNRDKVGFAAVYPPEKRIDLQANYPGQLDKVSWQPLSTKHDYGIIDIAEKIKNYKGSTMYATTDFYADREQTVEIRLGTPNAWKLWVNGKLMFAREEYHRGMMLDQYRAESVVLKPGRNTILFKICQNEQKEDWAQRYQFQIRVCDPTGSAILSQNKLTTSRATPTTLPPATPTPTRMR